MTSLSLHPRTATNLDEWHARRSLGRQVTGYDAVLHAARRWHPVEPLVVSAPGTLHFTPVLENSALRAIAHRSAARNHKLTIALACVGASVLFLLWILAIDKYVINMVVALILIAIFLAVDYIYVIHSVDALRERAAFIVWLHQNIGVDVAGWILFMLLCGTIQLILQHNAGSLETLLISFGLVYRLANDGEWWRFVTGPFFHSGIPHWIANLALLGFTGPLASSISRKAAVMVFLAGLILGGFASSTDLEWAPGDALVGISAGIFSLFGWCAAVSLRRPAEFPAHYGLTMILFGALNIAIVDLLAPRASTLAHATGWFSGLVFGFCVYTVRSRTAHFRQEMDSATAPDPGAGRSDAA